MSNSYLITYECLYKKNSEKFTNIITGDIFEFCKMEEARYQCKVIIIFLKQLSDHELHMYRQARMLSCNYQPETGSMFS